MTPLGRIAVGLLLVLLDLRLGAVDVVPDVLGWLLVVGGLTALVPRRPGLAAVRTAAVVAGVLSLADLVHPTRTTSTPTVTASAAGAPEGLQGLLSFGSMTASVVVAVLLSLRLRTLAADDGDGRRARTFGRFAVYHALVGGTMVLIGLVALAIRPTGAAEPAGGAAAILVLVVLAALLVESAFLLTLAAARLEPWAQPEGAPLDRAADADEPAG